MASKYQQKFILYVLFFLGIWISQATSRAIQGTLMTERHKQWMARYGRVYQDAKEEEKRYKIFEANVEYIDSFNNAGNQSYKLGVNEFADWTNEEFRASYNTNKSFSKKKSSPATSFRYRNFTAVPQSIDWRKKGAVTPIRDELCGKYYKWMNLVYVNLNYFRLV